MKTISIFLLLLCITKEIYAIKPLLSNAKIFHSEKKTYDHYQAISGKILFQDKDSDLFSKGYRPTTSFYIGGNISRLVYDFPNNYSAADINTRYINFLLKKEYTPIFQCERTECGSIAGWKLYMDGSIGGSTESQYYFSALSPHIEGKEKEYVFFHVADLDNRPRLVIHKVLGSMAIKTLQKHFISNISNDKRFSLIHEFFFDKGQFNHTNQLAAAQLGELSPGQEFYIIGYTDAAGDKAFNQDLSLKRAKSIKKWLINQTKINGNLIVVKGGGEFSTNMLKNIDPSKSRKASIYIFTPK